MVPWANRAEWILYAATGACCHRNFFSTFPMVARRGVITFRIRIDLRNVRLSVRHVLLGPKNTVLGAHMVLFRTVTVGLP